MLAWVIGLGLIAACGGTATPEPDSGWPELLFHERTHDFGAVPRGATVRHAFTLINRLNEPLTIVNLRASCGCTSGRASVSTIPPGGRALIEAAMDTTNFVNKKNTTLFVSLVSASGKQEEIGLGISVQILSDVVLNPGTIDFGTISRGQEVTRTLTVDHMASIAWKAEKMVSSSKVIDAWLDETLRDPRGVQYRLTVRLKPDVPAGLIRDEIRILTNDPESRVIPVLVTGQVLGGLSATPPILAMGRIPNNGQARGRYLVKGSKPFQIASIEGQGNGFSIEEVEAGSKPIHVLNVTYQTGPNTTLGDVRHVFRILTDLPGEAPLELVATLRVDP